jgi:general secretion pathway protein G
MSEPNCMRYGRPSRGFTLVELLVVVLIIGLLTSIVAPRLTGQISKSQQTAARAQLVSLEKALMAYRTDVGRFPTTAQGLRALRVQPDGEPRWRGPYLRQDVPPDPWGSEYQYKMSANTPNDFELSSWGEDRAPGGVGDAADIVL